LEAYKILILDLIFRLSVRCPNLAKDIEKKKNEVLEEIGRRRERTERKVEEKKRKQETFN
jgi:hypothetical protein